MNKVIVVELFGSNGQRGIVYNRSKSLATAIKGGNITTDYLEAGARLTGSVGSTVPGTVACLISTATAESFYISIGLINDGKSKLWLKRNGDRLTALHDFSAIFTHGSLVLSNGLHTFFFRVIVYVVIAVVVDLLVIPEHGIVGVIVDGAVLFLNLEGKEEGVLHKWIVLFVAYFFIRNGLHGRILCGMDGKTTLVEKLVGFGLGISGGHQILHNLINQCIYEVRVGIVSNVDVVLSNSGEYIVRQRLIIFLFRNHFLLQHGVKNQLLTFFAGFRMQNRIVRGRVLGNTGDNRAFR